MLREITIFPGKDKHGFKEKPDITDTTIELANKFIGEKFTDTCKSLPSQLAS